jgi:hypothetical protein
MFSLFYIASLKPSARNETAERTEYVVRPLIKDARHPLTAMRWNRQNPTWGIDVSSAEDLAEL